MSLPVLLIRRKHIIRSLLKKNALSEESAITFEEAGIINPNGFKRFTKLLVQQGILCQKEDKYYLNTAKL